MEMDIAKFDQKVFDIVSAHERMREATFAEIGKLTVERNCTEEKAKQQIEEKKKLIQYYNGYIEGATHIHKLLDQYLIEANAKP